jgi:hypothetical protein
LVQPLVRTAFDITAKSGHCVSSCLSKKKKTPHCSLLMMTTDATVQALIFSLQRFNRSIRYLSVKARRLFPESVEIYVASVQVADLLVQISQNPREHRHSDYVPLFEDLFEKLGAVEACLEDVHASGIGVAWRARNASRYRRFFAVSAEEFGAIARTLAETLRIPLPVANFEAASAPCPMPVSVLSITAPDLGDPVATDASPAPSLRDGRFRVKRARLTAPGFIEFVVEMVPSGTELLLRRFPLSHLPPDVGARLRREMEAACALRHIGLITPLEVFSDADRALCVVSPRPRGASLADWLAGPAPLASGVQREEMARWVVRGIAEALEALHGAGRAHGDLAPGSVVLGRGMQLSEPAPSAAFVRATVRGVGAGP